MVTRANKKRQKNFFYFEKNFLFHTSKRSNTSEHCIAFFYISQPFKLSTEIMSRRASERSINWVTSRMDDEENWTLFTLEFYRRVNLHCNFIDSIFFVLVFNLSHPAIVALYNWCDDWTWLWKLLHGERFEINNTFVWRVLIGCMMTMVGERSGKFL